MLRVRPFQGAKAARDYYTGALAKEDYYSEGHQILGQWHGKAADQLGLTGEVNSEAFAALTENRHPVTGEQLTPRNVANRNIAFDLNFHPPKSVSLLYAFTQDPKILEAFRESIGEAMEEVQRHAQTRVRRAGKNENRPTDNLVWAEFIHHTARPVGGIPDPHLHAHCFTFNATFDPVEQRWKATNYFEIKKNAPHFEAIYHAALARRLREQGFAIVRSGKGWEIDGIPRAMIDKYSRRSAEIDLEAERRGITDDRLKDELGAITRDGKRKGMSTAEIMAAWMARLTDEEKQIFGHVLYEKGNHRKEYPSAAEAVDHAVRHPV